MGMLSRDEGHVMVAIWRAGKKIREIGALEAVLERSSELSVPRLWMYYFRLVRGVLLVEPIVESKKKSE